MSFLSRVFGESLGDLRRRRSKPQGKVIFGFFTTFFGDTR